ncbi:low molecular mass early light-inducible protein HV90, chloroplastic-like [Miscanthus floridulus]
MATPSTQFASPVILPHSTSRACTSTSPSCSRLRMRLNHPQPTAVDLPPTWPPPPPPTSSSRAGEPPPLALAPHAYKAATPLWQPSHNSTARKVKQSNESHCYSKPLACRYEPTTRSPQHHLIYAPMAATAMASMTSLSFATAGARRAGAFPASALAPRRRALVVRAQSEDVEPTEETTPKAKKAARPGLWDALAFSGPAPERINGRLAMVGFVSALAVEASRGGGLLSQAGSGSGLAWFAATAAVLSVASLVPLLKGDSAEARSGAVMSADAELWNGRFAMLGLVALAFTEYLTGAPFINA